MRKQDLIVGNTYAISPRYAGRSVSLERSAPGRLLEINAPRDYNWGMKEHRVMMLDRDGNDDRERFVYSKDILAPWEEASPLVAERIAREQAIANRQLDREEKIGKVVDRLPGCAVGSATGREAEVGKWHTPITLRLDDVALEALIEAMNKVGMIL